MSYRAPTASRTISKNIPSIEKGWSLVPKECTSIREPKPCSEPGCAGQATTRGLCRKHYQRFRIAAIQAGIWEQIRLPCGNFGDPEGHTLSARMGGAKRSEDREGLRAAGRIGGRTFAANKEAQRALARLGGIACSRNRARMSARGRKGSAARWHQGQPTTPHGEGK
jgi:hypothetical protein